MCRGRCRAAHPARLRTGCACRRGARGRERPHGIHVGQDLGRDRRQLADQRVLVDFGLPEATAQRVVMHQQPVDLGPEVVQVLEILHADGAAPDLVLVGRPMPRPGGADLLAAGGLLAQLIELAVQRQDERGVLRNLQALSELTLMPWRFKPSISLTRCHGSRTTPLPMTLSLPGRTTPDGSSASL